MKKFIVKLLSCFKRLSMKKINKPITVGDVVVHPKDLIFADEGGVVVIYQKYEQEILDRALKTFQVENMIVRDIVHGVNINNILHKNGTF